MTAGRAYTLLSGIAVVQCVRGQEFKKSSESDVIVDVKCSSHSLMFLYVGSIQVACDN